MIKGISFGSTYNAVTAKTNPHFLYLYNTTGKPGVDRPFVEAGVPATNGVGTLAYRLVTVHISGTTVSHYLDGAANGTDTLATGSTSTDDRTLGVFGLVSGSFWLNAYLACLVGYKAALGTSTRESIEDTLGTYYGITITH